MPLPVELRHGFIWVTPTPGLAVKSELGAIGDDLEGFGLASHVVHRKVVCRRDSNWKLIVEAFLEGYHVKSLHRESIARFFLGYGTIFDTFGKNLRSVGARRDTAEARERPTHTWDVRKLGTVFYFLFPNTILVFHPDWVSHLSLWPEGVDRAVYEHRMLIPKAPSSPEESAHWDKTYALIEESVFQKEDLAIAESIQSTVRSGADTEFRIGRVEAGIKVFHDAMTEVIEAAPG